MLFVLYGLGDASRTYNQIFWRGSINEVNLVNPKNGRL